MGTSTNKATELPPVAKEYNGIDRNAWVFGWNPQQDLWNGRERHDWLCCLPTLGFGRL